MTKKTKLILSFFFMVLISPVAIAQTDTLYIHTSAQCGTCKKKIERDMTFAKGVKKVQLDLESRILKVIYQSSKTTPAMLREAVTNIGYDADSLLAKPDAYERLPACCKKGGHGH